MVNAWDGFTTALFSSSVWFTSINLALPHFALIIKRNFNLPKYNLVYSNNLPNLSIIHLDLDLSIVSLFTLKYLNFSLVTYFFIFYWLPYFNCIITIDWWETRWETTEPPS